MQIDTSPLLRIVNVEAVATEKSFRDRGFTSEILKRIAEEIQSYELGGLSPSRVAFYEHLGWECWRGSLYIRTKEGLIHTLTDESDMILRLRNTPTFTLDASLSAEWREGELW